MRTLLVLDKHPIFRDALAALLRVSVPAAHLICSADCRMLDEIEADLCFIDFERLGTAALAGLLNMRRSMHVVGTVESDAVAIRATAFAAGAAAVVDKAAPAEEFVRLAKYLLGLTRGRPSFDPDRVHFPAAAGSADGRGFSDTELRLIGLLARGLKNGEIAQALGFSVNTVKVYNSRLYRRFGVSSRTKLVLKLRGS